MHQKSHQFPTRKIIMKQTREKKNKMHLLQKELTSGEVFITN